MLLPGPPPELKPMFANECLPRLERRLPPQVIRTRLFRVAGMGESDLDQLIAPVYTKYTNPSTTILAAAGDIQIHLRARCTSGEEAERLLEEVGQPIEALLGERLYSRNGDSLEVVVGKLLRARGATLSVAESCTGGMLGERITSVRWQLRLFRGRLSGLQRSHENGDTGRGSGADRRAYARERRGRASDGGRGARANGIDVCDFGHGRSRPRERYGRSRGNCFYRIRRSGRIGSPAVHSLWGSQRSANAGHGQRPRLVAPQDPVTWSIS